MKVCKFYHVTKMCSLYTNIHKQVVHLLNLHQKDVVLKVLKFSLNFSFNSPVLWTLQGQFLTCFLLKICSFQAPALITLITTSDWVSRTWQGSSCSSQASHDNTDWLLWMKSVACHLEEPSHTTERQITVVWRVFAHLHGQNFGLSYLLWTYRAPSLWNEWCLDNQWPQEM